MQSIPFYKAEAELCRLPHEGLRSLSRKGRLVRFKPNSQIITQGQTGQEIFVVLDGKLEAYIHSNGRKERRLTLAVLQAGDIFGEIGLDGGQRTASVCAVSASVCAMVHANDVVQQRAKDPALQDFLTMTANQRNRQNTVLMTQTIFCDIFTRMVDLLMGMSQPLNPEYNHVCERITHQEIANRLGCSREMVSRLLKDLEKGGYIARRKDQTLLLKQPMPVAW
jgi:CRP/FNR family transcriptional regulator, cyclic AMP receptor protein